MASYLVNNIPDKDYREAKAALALDGRTMRDFLIECIRTLAERQAERGIK